MNIKTRNHISNHTEILVCLCSYESVGNHISPHGRYYSVVVVVLVYSTLNPLGTKMVVGSPTVLLLLRIKGVLVRGMTEVVPELGVGPGPGVLNGNLHEKEYMIIDVS